MAKHPVPKKKTSKARSKQRYAKFAFEAARKLINRVSLTTCDNCGAKKRNHYVCRECGTYRGRQVLNNKEEKITKIKA